MSRMKLYAFGLLMVGFGTFGMLATPRQGAAAIGDDQAAQVQGGQYCSQFLIGMGGCGQSAGQGLNCPTTGLLYRVNYPGTGAPGTTQFAGYCSINGSSCGVYENFNPCN
jgi:hypothetical protein